MIQQYHIVVSGATQQEIISETLALPVHSLSSDDYVLMLNNKPLRANMLLSDYITFHVPNEALIHLTSVHGSQLRGGKGGFGAQLRSQGKRAGQTQTTDMGDCRDLSGRRIRDVMAEQEAQKAILEREAEANNKEREKEEEKRNEQEKKKQLINEESSKARDNEEIVRSAVLRGLQKTTTPSQQTSKPVPKVTSSNKRKNMFSTEFEDLSSDSSDSEREEEDDQVKPTAAKKRKQEQ